jgi:ribosomal protein L37E
MTLCSRCKVGAIHNDYCSRCGYKVSTREKRQENMARLIRNSLLGLVSLLVGVLLIRLL